MRRAVVTGAAEGIGLACATMFRRHGWTVLAIDRNEIDAAHGLQSVLLDVSDADAPAAISRALGGAPLHALVNNAAIAADVSLAQISRELFDSVTAVNLRAPLELTAALADNLAAATGAVVNVASVHAVATSPNVSAYAASKGGLVALTRAAAVELGPRGVRCNAVLPGAVDTAMLAAGMTRGVDSEAAPARRADLESRTPLRRIGRTEEIAEAILFLADGARSSFITGQTLVVDGGVTARLASES